MITFIIITMLALVVFLAVKAKGLANTVKDTKKAITSAVKEITKTDPLEDAEARLKTSLDSLVKLDLGTKELEQTKKTVEKKIEESTVIAKLAKEAGNTEDLKSCFEIIQTNKETLEATDKDLEANNQLYKRLTSQVSELELNITKAKATRERNKARSAANELRRDLAKDVLHGEGLATIVEDDSVELEADSYEKVRSDVYGDDLSKKYDVVDTSEEFAKFQESL